MADEEEQRRAELKRAIDGELFLVRKKYGWREVDLSRLRHLMALATQATGRSDRSALQTFLLDLFDPVAAGQEREPLKSRDPKDEGLMMRWLFGEPDEEFEIRHPDGRVEIYSPAGDDPVPERINQLAVYRGQGKNTLFRARDARRSRGGAARERLHGIIDGLAERAMELETGDHEWPVAVRGVLREGLTALDDAVQSVLAATVERELEQHVVERAKAGVNPTVLYGEPGSGKSVLAIRAAARLTGRVLVIRWSPDAHSTTTVFHADLLDALNALDVDALTWSAPALVAGLREEIAKPHPVAVVFDGIPPDVQSKLLPRNPKVPVIVTTRRAAADAVLVGRLTDDEALSLARRYLPEESDGDLGQLAGLVGNHAIAVDAVSRLVVAGRYTLTDLRDLVLASPTVGLELLEGEGQQQGGGSVVVMREMLDQALNDQQLDSVLLGLVWLCGARTELARARHLVLGDAPAHESEFRLALARLENFGLVEVSRGAVSMNDFTRSVAREITNDRLLRVANDFRIRVTRSTTLSDYTTLLDDERRAFLSFFRMHFPESRFEIWCMDEDHWIVFGDPVQSAPGDGVARADEPDRHVSLIEVIPSMVVEWASTRRPRTRPSGDRLHWLAQMTCMYTWISAAFHRDRKGATWRRPWIYPGDANAEEFLHQVIEPPTRPRDAGEPLMTVCGSVTASGRLTRGGPPCRACANPKVASAIAVAVAEPAKHWLEQYQATRVVNNEACLKFAVAQAWAASQVGSDRKQRVEYLCIAAAHIVQAEWTPALHSWAEWLVQEFAQGMQGRRVTNAAIAEVWHTLIEACEELGRAHGVRALLEGPLTVWEGAPSAQPMGLSEELTG